MTHEEKLNLHIILADQIGADLLANVQPAFPGYYFYNLNEGGVDARVIQVNIDEMKKNRPENRKLLAESKEVSYTDSEFTDILGDELADARLTYLENAILAAVCIQYLGQTLPPKGDRKRDQFVMSLREMELEHVPFKVHEFFE